MTEPTIIGMTAEEEIHGLKQLCKAWRKECQRYEKGLHNVRINAMQAYDQSDFESDSWLAIIEQINGILAFDDQCQVCGDHHEGDVPRECETGDGL